MERAAPHLKREITTPHCSAAQWIVSRSLSWPNEFFLSGALSVSLSLSLSLALPLGILPAEQICFSLSGCLGHWVNCFSFSPALRIKIVYRFCRFLSPPNIYLLAFPPRLVPPRPPNVLLLLAPARPPSIFISKRLRPQPLGMRYPG